MEISYNVRKGNTNKNENNTIEIYKVFNLYINIKFI